MISPSQRARLWCFASTQAVVKQFLSSASKATISLSPWILQSSPSSTFASGARRSFFSQSTTSTSRASHIGVSSVSYTANAIGDRRQLDCVSACKEILRSSYPTTSRLSGRRMSTAASTTDTGRTTTTSSTTTPLAPPQKYGQKEGHSQASDPLRGRVSSYEPLTVKGGRVMSIQSHVVHGYVGNKSAVFPLQVLGFDVDPVNSVQFSNHTGFKVFKGEVLNGDQLWALVEGLEANNLCGQYSHLLTGYIGSESFLKTVVRLFKTLKSHNPQLKYFCDPVMGDSGRIYVPKTLVDLYRTEILPVATAITPNQFEAELLTGMTIKTEADALAACAALHSMGPELVVITSFDPPEGEEIEYGENRTGQDQHQQFIGMIASKRRPMPGPLSHTKHGEELDQYRLNLPKLEGSYTGTGDLVAALLLAWTTQYPWDLPYALEKAGATMNAVLKRTLHDGGPGADIRLIQSKRDIEDPPVNFRCLALRRTIKGVVFDMDGTLTAPGALDFNTIRKQFDLPNTQNILVDIESAPLEQQAAAVRAVEEEERRGTELLELQEGLHDVISELKARGIRVGVATRNAFPAVEAFLEKAELSAKDFDPIITRNFPFVKPHPGVLRAACEQWQIQPSNVMMIGDSRDDMLCGREAGAVTCLVKHHKNGQVVELADHLIDSLTELMPIIGSYNSD